MDINLTKCWNNKKEQFCQQGNENNLNFTKNKSNLLILFKGCLMLNIIH